MKAVRMKRGFTLGPEQEKEILLSIAQADRGETIPAAKVLAALSRRSKRLLRDRCR